MVKDNRHRTRAISGDGGEIAINSKRQVFTLVSEIQNEVHRFSVAYHHQKHAKRGLSLSLTEIEGVGEKRASALLKYFKTMTAIKNAEVDDLADSTNYTLRTAGYPERTRDEVRRFVGNGIYKLIERAVPTGTDKAEIDKCFDIFCRNYKKNMANKTKPYPGITDMLKTLYENGFKLAIVTNKADFAAQELCGEMFGDYVKTVVGSVKERRNKPYPDNVLFAMDKMGAEKSETVYVGDSEVDVETAKNSGLSVISVLWGYRDIDVLKKAGAEKTAKNAEELKNILLNLKK